jgi:hypothetical protein
MIRSWLRNSAALLLTGCAASGPTFKTAAKLPSADRKPDGIAVDLVSEPPPYVATAEAKDGVVTLRTPLGTAAAMAAVRTFFESVLREDMNAMLTVTTPAALVNDTRGSVLTRSYNVRFLWQQRFGKYDYALLSGRVIYRDSDVRTYRSADAEQLPYELKAAMVGDPLQEGDVVLRVPIVNHSVKSERLLGDELTFWLRREDARFVIYRIAEEVPL